MNRPWGVSLRALAISTAGLGLAIPVASWAQASPGEPPVVDEIVVTAQRKEERLSDVPIAVTALSQDQLDARQMTSASDLQLLVPNLSYTDTNFGGANFSIRGIGRSVIGDGADSGVAIHSNGAFIQGDTTGGEFFDLDRVEVLRGPQGTLFGRNATGGAINIVSAKPSPDLAAALELGVASFDGRYADGMLNLPMGDKAATRLAFRASREDGWVRNVATGSWINGGELVSVRNSWSFDPTSSTHIDLIGSYSEASGSAMTATKRLCHRDPVGNLGCLSDRLDFEAPNFRGTLEGALASLDTSRAIRGVQSIVPVGADPFMGSLTPANYREVAMDFDPSIDNRTINVTLGV